MPKPEETLLYFFMQTPSGVKTCFVLMFIAIILSIGMIIYESIHEE
ncbi:MAG: hypothetical protein J6T10_25495 [Methanobrevibacter sp.]|nr:hypothetical protein [Methanobrevibacter sp.]